MIVQFHYLGRQLYVVRSQFFQLHIINAYFQLIIIKELTIEGKKEMHAYNDPFSHRCMHNRTITYQWIFSNVLRNKASSELLRWQQRLLHEISTFRFQFLMSGAVELMWWDNMVDVIMLVYSCLDMKGVWKKFEMV